MMFDISDILPFEAFVIIMIMVLGSIACWPSRKGK